MIFLTFFTPLLIFLVIFLTLLAIFLTPFFIFLPTFLKNFFIVIMIHGERLFSSAQHSSESQCLIQYYGFILLLARRQASAMEE